MLIVRHIHSRLNCRTVQVEKNERSGGIYKKVRSEVIPKERDNPGKKWASKEAKSRSRQNFVL